MNAVVRWARALTPANAARRAADAYGINRGYSVRFRLRCLPSLWWLFIRVDARDWSAYMEKDS